MTPARRRLAVLALPVLWMAVFFLAPFAIVLSISTAEIAEGLPPYAWPEGGTAANFRTLLEDPSTSRPISAACASRRSPRCSACWWAIRWRWPSRARRSGGGTRC
jgi:ABC-type spermidine/putrescine transport system permease subunit I